MVNQSLTEDQEMDIHQENQGIQATEWVCGKCDQLNIIIYDDF